MRATWVFAGLVFLWLLRSPLHAQAPAVDTYEAILQGYVSGNADAAIIRLAKLDRSAIEQGYAAVTSGTAARMRAAAAIHTEVALRPGVPDPVNRPFHLSLAASIVELGEPLRVKLKPNGPWKLNAPTQDPVGLQFRHVWYLAAITFMQGAGRLGTVDDYLAHARLLFPRGAEMLLRSGIAEEMRASPRLASAGGAYRRRALERAEKDLRLGLQLEPGHGEIRLRLGRVLQLRGEIEEARLLLADVADGDTVRRKYLASLFLGGLEDAAGRPANAASWYARAGALLPSGQAARLAANELQHRSGDRRSAADAIPAATGDTNALDPWWSYLFGEYWKINEILDELRNRGQP